MDSVGFYNRGMTMSLFLTQKTSLSLSSASRRQTWTWTRRSIIPWRPLAPSKHTRSCKHQGRCRRLIWVFHPTPESLSWVCSHRAWTNLIKKDNIFPWHVTSKHPETTCISCLVKSVPLLPSLFYSPQPFVDLSLFPVHHLGFCASHECEPPPGCNKLWRLFIA